MRQPRNEDGRFTEWKVVESEDGKIEFVISEYECRVIGHRLRKAQERFERIHSEVTCRIEQDCAYWSRRFLDQVSSRDRDEEYYENGKKRHTDSNYNVKLRLSDYECWSLGNRLFEIGEWFEKKGHESVAIETKWLARRFHAEQKEHQEED